MNRLRHLEEHRYIGIRDHLVLCDGGDELGFSALQARVEAEDLIGLCRISTFGPQ